MVRRVGWGGSRELLFDRDGVSVLQGEKRSGDDGAGVCTTVRVRLMPLNCALGKG